MIAPILRSLTMKKTYSPIMKTRREMSSLALRESTMKAKKGAKLRKREIKTSMPGRIVKVFVKEGDKVREGQAVLVLEAMKMQNDIVSDVTGVVRKIHFKAGEQASFGEPLIEIDVE